MVERVLRFFFAQLQVQEAEARRKAERAAKFEEGRRLKQARIVHLDITATTSYTLPFQLFKDFRRESAATRCQAASCRSGRASSSSFVQNYSTNR